MKTKRRQWLGLWVAGFAKGLTYWQHKPGTTTPNSRYLSSFGLVRLVGAVVFKKTVERDFSCDLR